MRLEPNVSLRETRSMKHETRNIALPNYKVEVKNINSFRFAKAAIEYELKRQQAILEKGEIPEQETRGWDESKKATVSQRNKEEAHDYRYFPEPDIPEMELSDQEIVDIKHQLPELPGQKVARYVNQIGLKVRDAFTLTRDQKTAEYFEAVIKKVKGQQNMGQSVANLIVNKKISTDISIDEFIKNVEAILTPKKIDQDLMAQVIDKVISENKSAVVEYKAGKETVIMFLVGQVMKDMKGEADANLVRQKLINELINVR